MVCKQVSKRFAKPPDWWTPSTPFASPPSLRKPDDKCHEDKKLGTSRYCTRCQEEVNAEELVRKDEMERDAEEKRAKGDRKKNFREIIKKRARAQKQAGPPHKKSKC